MSEKFTTAEILQEFLAKAFFGKEWAKNKRYVVHRQGNLANAQQRYNSSAWFTYYVSNYTKKTINPTLNQTENTHTCNVVFNLNLQCIGKDAERFMLTTLFWDEREDIRSMLDRINCVLLDTPRSVVSAPYFQDGANTILSYETVFKISCALTITEELPLMPFLELRGGLKIGS